VCKTEPIEEEPHPTNTGSEPLAQVAIVTLPKSTPATTVAVPASESIFL